MINSAAGKSRILRFTQLLLSGAMITLPAAAWAQTVPVETITVTGAREMSTAAQEAPTVAPLDAIEPTSVISLDGALDKVLTVPPKVALPMVAAVPGPRSTLI